MRRSIASLFQNAGKSHDARVQPIRHPARLVDLVRASKVPVVGVTETAPPDVSYQHWMLDQLTETEKALAGPST
jgi:hypothetical protein